MKKENLEFFGTGAAIGACIGLGLSFAALSPLVIGGIIGFLPMTALYIKGFLNNQVSKTKEYIPIVSVSLTAAAAVGVALNAAASSLLPGVTLSTWSAALSGTVIGAVIGLVGMASAIFTASYIIAPVVEKVAECFSKKVPVN